MTGVSFCMGAAAPESRLSYQCQDSNIDHHGYCDGTADDGGRCECPNCKHPEEQS